MCAFTAGASLYPYAVHVTTLARQAMIPAARCTNGARIADRIKTVYANRGHQMGRRAGDIHNRCQTITSRNWTGGQHLTEKSKAADQQTRLRHHKILMYDRG